MRRWLAGAALVTLGLLASPGAVPVYDGVGTPDEPYRFVGKDPAPTSVVQEVPLSGGASASLQLKSAESGPQVVVDLGAGAFRTTSSASSFSATATPVLPDAAPVPRGELDGNVYRIAVTGDVRLDPETAQGFLFLRAAVMTTPDPVLVHRLTPTDPWVEVKTTRAGRDNLSTPFREVGDYAVVRLPGSTPLDSSGGLSTTRVLLLAGGVLLLLVLTVLVLRRPQPDEDADLPVS